MKMPKGYWTVARIDEAHDQLEVELGRSPRPSEFQKRYPGAASAIFQGNYPGVRYLSDYLKLRSRRRKGKIQL